MIKRFLIVAVIASTFALPTFAGAEAGPIRDRAKAAVKGTVELAAVGAMTARCALKGRRGTILC